jgi:indoleamine 2,3-dioxygenase
LDENKPIRLDNLATMIQFYGGLDESWFYLVTVEIEQIGAPAIPLVLEAMDFTAAGLFLEATTVLEKVNTILSEILVSLQKIYDHCDPYVFFLRVRPFLGSFEILDFRGTGLPPQNLHGASAAQSSLLQFFDAAFGINYDNENTKNYLLLMRKHMPEKHASFLTFIEKTSTLRTDVLKNHALHEVYKKCIQRLIEFRNEHLKIVALYIMKQAKEMNKSSKGTGGTSPMVFLKSVRNQNKEVL